MEGPVIADNPAEFPINRHEVILEPSAPEINVPEATPDHIPYRDSFIDVVYNDSTKAIVFNNTEIAHEHFFGDNKIWMLDDKFQDGAKYNDVREAFATAFKNTVDVDSLGKKIFPTNFEGGTIHIIAGVGENQNGLRVLLNGKEIANGLLTDDHHIANLQMLKNLKGGWFLADNVYERAFKRVNLLVKAMKKGHDPFY